MNELSLPATALAAHRERALDAWALEKGIVLAASGLRVPIAGTDGHHEFHAHADHFYLTGLDRPGQVLAFDPDEGFSLFVHVASEVEMVWEGGATDLEAIRASTGIDVHDRSDLAGWLAKRSGRPLAMLGNADLGLRPEAYGLADGEGIAPDPELSDRLRTAIWELRRVKDEAELKLMRRAAIATRAGHITAIRVSHPGMSELDLRAEIEVEFLRAGGRRPAYETIVAGGPNAAVLHYAPGRRPFAYDDLVLVDAGAEYAGYMCDVTRTFPAGEAFTPEQRDVYDVVLEAQTAAVAGARAGVEYKALHLETCERMARGLVDLGVLRGDPSSLVERDVHALFFPHGLGHLIGLATHDVAGYLAGRERERRFGLEFLRADLPLEPGHVVTIEPGIYFIRALLTDPDRRTRFKDDVDWGRVDGLLDLGGVRIEDTVHVTDGDPEVLTAAIPKDRGEVEELSAG